jgi:hypothetical protein
VKPVAFVLLAAGIAGAAMVVPRWIFARVIQHGNSFFSRSQRGFVLCAALVIAARLALLPWAPVPAPRIADEFSYLLLGDTFLHGRLANPPHPLWEHFETLFVLHHPAYASVYPVAQGVLIFLGRCLFGNGWAGILTGGGLFCGALFWMLRGWMPGGWAVYGAILAAIQVEIFSYWLNSYWGGIPAATGACLVYGALPRMLRRIAPRDSVALAAGLVLLANSRPYEGLVVSIPALVYLGSAARLRNRAAASRLLIPLLAILACAGLAMGYYFRRVTGSPFVMPYARYAAEYAAAPAFLVQRAPSTPEYRTETLRDAHLSFAADYREYASIRGFARLAPLRLAAVAQFYLGPTLIILVLTGPSVWRSRKLRRLAVGSGTVLAALLVAVPFQPHYAAPAAPLLAALVTAGLRALWLMGGRRGTSAGRAMVLAVPVICLVGQLTGPAFYRQPSRVEYRQKLLEQLRSQGGKHLVIVRYEAGHGLSEEWIYNDADIDRAPVVWARDLGEDKNETLRRYYADRVVWLLLADRSPAQLERYSEAAARIR